MCRLIRFLYALVRWKKFRAFLIRKHMESCPLCSDAPPVGPGDRVWTNVIRPPDWIRAEGSMWPEIQKRMREGSAAASARAPSLPPVIASRHHFLGSLIPAAAGLAAVAVLGVLAWRAAHRVPGAAEAGIGRQRVEVLSAEVEGRKARPFIFQTKDTSYIWFSQTPDEGGRK
jgi:hypothetical protein